MRSLRTVFELTVLLCLTSCVEETKLVYLGYTRPYCTSDSLVSIEPFANWPTQSYRPIGMSVSGIPMPGSIDPYEYTFPRETMSYLKVKPAKTHRHYMVSSYRYGIFCPEGYVSECDIEDARNIVRGVTKRNLDNMLRDMCDGNFDRRSFKKRFACLMSREVLQKIVSAEADSLDETLGGWQMFKPTKGIDAEQTSYNIMYRDGGWYDIVAPEGSDTVSVRTVIVGKYLNPIIVEVRNPKMNVSVSGTNYKPSARTRMLASDKYNTEFIYLRFMCPLIYKESQPAQLVTDEDFDKLKAKANTLKLAFVETFYRDILASGNDLKTIQKKYRYSMAWRLAGMTDSLMQAKNCSTDMFLPCSYSDFATGNHTVTYLGDDWYQVSAAGKSLKLKVVLYGKRLTPAIMGMRNPSQNIDYCPGRFTWLDGNK
jgi:hypothetical protein